MTIDISPGYIKVLGAIFGVQPKDTLYQRYGLLPPGKKKCVGCGKLIAIGYRGEETGDCCQECQGERHHVTLQCGQCGKEFRITRAEYNGRLKHRKIPLFFCGRRCYGKYTGINYGLHVHPENAGRKRKYDYQMVYSLWEATKCSCGKLSRALGIPEPTIYSIMYEYPPYLEYRKAKSQK